MGNYNQVFEINKVVPNDNQPYSIDDDGNNFFGYHDLDSQDFTTNVYDKMGSYCQQRGSQTYYRLKENDSSITGVLENYATPITISR